MSSTKISKTRKKKIQETEKQENAVEKEKNEIAYSKESKPMTTEFISLFWNDLYQLYLSDLSRKNMDFFNEVKNMENMLKQDPGFIEVLIMFKRIIPTIQVGDYAPLKLLEAAIDDVMNVHDYNRLCIFMRIATSRFDELQKNWNQNKESAIGRKGNKLSIDSSNKNKRKEAELLVPLFDELIAKNWNFTKAIYKGLFIPKLIDNKEILFRLLSVILEYMRNHTRRNTKNNQKDIKSRKEELERLKTLFKQLDSIQKDLQDSSSTEKELQIVTERKESKLTEIKKILKDDCKLYDRIKSQFRTRKKDYNDPQKRIGVILPSVRIIISQSHLENVLWKKMNPWPINKEYEEWIYERELEQEYDPELALEKANEIKKAIYDHYDEKNTILDCPEPDTEV